MALVPIIALCALLDGAPQPDMNRCVFVEDNEPTYAEMGECAARAEEMKDTPMIRQRAADGLYDRFGYIGPQGYALWCIPEREMKDFYRHFGVEHNYIDEEV